MAPRHQVRLDIRTTLAAAVTLALVLITGCTAGAANSPRPSADPDALRVVATNTVLADLVTQVGGSRVEVLSLIPAGREVHTYDPSPSDAQAVAQADLVVMNGLGLDEWLADLVADVGSTAPVIEVAEDLEGVGYLAGGEHHEDGGAASGTDDHAGEAAANPHVWMNVAYARMYVARIAEALAAADPDDAADYAADAAAYDGTLAELDAWVRERLKTIPAGNRKVVSFHDAFPYYAAAYGLTVVDTILEAPGQDPSAGEIGDLVGLIRSEGVRAILSEAEFSDELVQTIAAETGAVVIADLYTESLGAPPVDSYEGMLRYDTDRIVTALE
jgi:ABC-type Zn uptake system ZnuABC Zn-binding protein ZnuA